MTNPFSAFWPAPHSCLVAQTVKHLLTMQETRLQSLDREDLLEKAMQPTPVLLPGQSHGRRSLAGYSPWGRKKSDTAEWLHFHFNSWETPKGCLSVLCNCFLLSVGIVTTWVEEQNVPQWPVSVFVCHQASGLTLCLPEWHHPANLLETKDTR